MKFKKKLIQLILSISKNGLYWFWKNKDKNRVSHLFYDTVCAFSRSVLPFDAFSVSSHDLYSNSNDSRKTVIKTGREGCFSNIVWSNSEQQEVWSKPLKDLCIYEHHNVYVCGDSDIVIDQTQKTGINDLCYELSGVYKYGDSFAFDIKDGMMLVKSLDYSKARRVKSGIMIAALYSYNYFHCVLDNLIRLLAVEECNIPQDAVYIIDSVVYKYDSLKRIFETLTENSKREVVLLNRRELLQVENLYYITHVNEFVIKIENWKFGRYDDYTFDWNYMKALRDKLLKLKNPDARFGSRIFISRKNIPRRQFNEEDLMVSLSKVGFVSVCPEELSLDEQIALFNNAEIIVSSSGAAMTNLLFCAPGAKVLIIDGMKHQSSMYSLIPAKVDAKCLHYSIQVPVNGKYDEDFSLDVDDFMFALRSFMAKPE